MYATPIPWPVGLTGPDNQNSYSLMNTYGEMNNNWVDVGPGLEINFHTGIDIRAADIGSDNVWCIEDGVYSDVHAFVNIDTTVVQYIATICENSSSAEGWTYCHVEGTDGAPHKMQWVASQTPNSVPAVLGQKIGTAAILPERRQTR